MDRDAEGEPLGRPPDTFGSVGRATLWSLYGVAFAMALLPILVTPILPLVDLPNHLARAYILNHLDADPTLQKYYKAYWHLLAFQSTDFLLPPLARLFGVFVAGRIYTAATFLVLFGGTIALHRVLFGRIGLAPLASVLFLYNIPLAWGFVSYLFSAGLALFMLAAWIGTEKRRSVARVLGFSLAIFALLLCHSFTFGAYAVLVATYEFGRIWSERTNGSGRAFRRLVEGGLPFVPSCIFVAVSVDRSMPAVTDFGSANQILHEFLNEYLVPTTMYKDWADVAPTLAVLAGWFICRRYLRTHVAVPMRFPLVAMTITGFCIPVWLFSVWGANYRIPPLIALLLVASTEIKPRDLRQAMLFTSGILLVFAFRVVTVTQAWHGYETDYETFRVAAANIERGSRVLGLPLPDRMPDWPAPSLRPYSQLVTLTVIDRNAFVPSLFTGATPLVLTTPPRGLVENYSAAQQPLQWHPTDARFASVSPATIRAVEQLGEFGLMSGSYSSPVDWSRWPQDFDYLVIFHFGHRNNPVPALLTSVAEGSFFTIFRIHPPQAE